MHKVLAALLAALPILALAATGHAEKARDERKVADKKQEMQNSVGMKFVLVKAGKFLMGSTKDEEDSQRDERPRHEVELTSDFYVGIHEVTQSHWKAVTGWKRNDYEQADRPVYDVNMWHVDDFLGKLNALEAEKKAGRVYRLPTEAEWEYACRGGHLIPKIGTTAYLPFHFEKPSAKLSYKMASFKWESPYLTNTKPDRETTSHRHAVGSFAPNALGIYDMHGNVMEWCADWYDPKVYQDDDRKDPRGPAKGSRRVLRGGSWLDDGADCRAASRRAEAPGYRSLHVGFRVVCEVRK